MVGMPKLIQKGFIVGDRHFLSYDEAQKFASAHRVQMERAQLIQFLREDGHQVDDEEQLADLLLSAYEIKPKKRND